MNLKEGFNYQQAIQKNELEKTLQLLNKNVEIFKYLVLKSNSLDQKIKSMHESVDTNRISGALPKEDASSESLEQWVSNQEIKQRNTKSSRSIIDILEHWVENDVKKDLLKSLDAKYSHNLPQELSSKNIRELGLRLISLADKLENK